MPKKKKSIFEMVFGEDSEKPEHEASEMEQAMGESREDYMERMRRKKMTPKPPK